MIDHMPSLKEIFVKFGDAPADLETLKTFVNHPSNPRINMRLVEYSSYDDASTKHKQPCEILEEEYETLELGSDGSSEEEPDGVVEEDQAEPSKEKKRKNKMNIHDNKLKRLARSADKRISMSTEESSVSTLHVGGGGDEGWKHIFDKVLQPIDMGTLIIPRQLAEKDPENAKNNPKTDLAPMGDGDMDMEYSSSCSEAEDDVKSSSSVTQLSPWAPLSSSSSVTQLQQRATPSPSRFKGVVPQPNGCWGAQIYEKHSRVWLGTFRDEETAARAYDVAALRFGGCDAVTNHQRPPAAAEVAGSSSTGELDPELVFLNDHSKAEIVDMLRKHTYDEELRQGLRRGGGRAQPTPAWAREHLFEKAVTPSDVGRLNHLVVPKQHAERHFPQTVAGGSNKKGVLLYFEDGEGKLWRFRYSYGNSSQSYVLTKGWSRFVREKGLGAGDTVVFSCSTYGPEKQFFIDYKKKTADAAIGDENETGHVAVKLFGVDIAGGGRKFTL